METGYVKEKVSSVLMPQEIREKGALIFVENPP